EIRRLGADILQHGVHLRTEMMVGDRAVAGDGRNPDLEHEAHGGNPPGVSAPIRARRTLARRRQRRKSGGTQRDIGRNSGAYSAFMATCEMADYACANPPYACCNATGAMLELPAIPA